MNRLIKASTKVEVDPEAMEKLMVEKGDFLHALENDVKPVSYNTNITKGHGFKNVVTVEFVIGAVSFFFFF